MKTTHQIKFWVGKKGLRILFNLIFHFISPFFETKCAQSDLISRATFCVNSKYWTLTSRWCEFSEKPALYWEFYLTSWIALDGLTEPWTSKTRVKLDEIRTWKSNTFLKSRVVLSFNTFRTISVATTTNTADIIKWIF